MTLSAEDQTRARILFVAVLMVVIWELLGRFSTWGPAILPSPSRILIQAFADRELYGLYGSPAHCRHDELVPQCRP